MTNLPVDISTALTKFIPKIRLCKKIKLKSSRHDSATQTKCELLPSARSILNYVGHCREGGWGIETRSNSNSGGSSGEKCK
jgi:hypothetical protein